MDTPDASLPTLAVLGLRRRFFFSSSLLRNLLSVPGTSSKFEVELLALRPLLPWPCRGRNAESGERYIDPEVGRGLARSCGGVHGAWISSESAEEEEEFVRTGTSSEDVERERVVDPGRVYGDCPELLGW